MQRSVQEIPKVLVGDSPLDKYISTFFYQSKRNGKVMIAARGRNSNNAINLALWVKMNGEFDIESVALESVPREAREDPKRTIFVSQINILMCRRNDGHGVH